MIGPLIVAYPNAGYPSRCAWCSAVETVVVAADARGRSPELCLVCAAKWAGQEVTR